MTHFEFLVVLRRYRVHTVWTAALAIWVVRSKNERAHAGIAVTAAVLMVAFIIASGLVPR